VHFFVVSDLAFLYNEPMKTIARHFRRSVPSLSRERFIAFAIDASGSVVGSEVLGVGSEDAVEIDTDAAESFASKYYSRRVVFAHNHPSDSLAFSEADVLLCARLRTTCKNMVDFLIVTRTEHFSFADDGRV